MSSIIQFRNKKLIIADGLLGKTIHVAKKAADSSLPVFISGESGTGKELIARYIHESGPRSRMPFVSVNCAALPEGLVEAELFGYEKGAFTGATAQKIGKFELASHGTLLLDEVSEMPISLQAKLLRVLQEGEIDRLGGRHPIPIHTRVIATSNQDPVRLIQAGLFREDLYYRLNVLRIECLPLRGRPEAIINLAESFLTDSDGGRQFSETAIEKLCRHDWPGNVRELKNVIDRAGLLSSSEVIKPEDLEVSSSVKKSTDISSEKLSDLERGQITRVLTEASGNREEAARRLGITSRTLRNKLRLYRSEDPSNE